MAPESLDRRVIRTSVDWSGSGIALDIYLAGRFTYRSLEEWRDRIRGGEILLNGELSAPDRILALHDRIEYFPGDLPEPEADLRYRIAYEDEELLVVDKSGNLCVHPSGPFFRHTLWHLLCSKYGRIYLVNRLDRETSGLLIAAKNPRTAAKLGRPGWLIRKEYLALVFGRFDTPVAALASTAKRRTWLNTMEDFLLWRARPDGALLELLPEALKEKRALVVLHLMGSHGPYQQRYPENFAEELDWHAYDKSVLYTDSLLEKMIDLFRNNPRVRAAVYVSDHSEIPGVGHAADLFEPEMAAIPMFCYLSEELRRERPELERTLRSHAESIFTNDLVFELMLDLMGIRHRFSPPELRFADPRYALTPERALTLWGKFPLKTPAPALAPAQNCSTSSPERGTLTRTSPDSGARRSTALPTTSKLSPTTGREAKSSTSSSAPEPLTTRHRRPAAQSTGTVMPGL